MTENQVKTIVRDSGNGQFISRRQALNKPRNTWQQERVLPGKVKRQASHSFHYPKRLRPVQRAQWR
jgi:hypothetical protein